MSTDTFGIVNILIAMYNHFVSENADLLFGKLRHFLGRGGTGKETQKFRELSFAKLVRPEIDTSLPMLNVGAGDDVEIFLAAGVGEAHFVDINYNYSYPEGDMPQQQSGLTSLINKIKIIDPHAQVRLEFTSKELAYRYQQDFDNIYYIDSRSMQQEAPNERQKYKLLPQVSGRIEFMHEGQQKVLHVLGEDATQLSDEYTQRNYSVFASTGAGIPLTFPHVKAQIYAVSNLLPEIFGFSDFVVTPSEAIINQHRLPVIARRFEDHGLTSEEIRTLDEVSFIPFLISSARKMRAGELSWDSVNNTIIKDRYP